MNIETLLPKYNRTVLVVTFGRTGSTLLQGILNSIDGFCIRGENLNFCYGLYSLYRRHFLGWKGFSKNLTTELPTKSWYGARYINEKALISSMRSMVLQQLYPGGGEYHTLGFKEIRYIPEEEYVHNSMYLIEYLDFLTRLFKNIRFVFNTRDYEQVIKSGWWPERDREDCLRQFRLFDKMSAVYAEKHPDICYSITYQDIVENNLKVQGLFSFLGESCSQEKVDKVLQVQHSYNVVKT